MERGGQPAELQPILSSLNALFARISDHLEREHRFIDDAAHEIRTPLTVIKAQSQAIDENKLDEESKHLFHNIVEGIDRTSRLASRLLEQARASQPHIDQQEMMNIVPAVQQLLASTIPLADEKSIELEYDGPDSAMVTIHPDDLGSILTNLIGNAIHHTPSGGKILIRLGKEQDHYCLSVEDSGPGVPKDKRNEIFERFHRLPQARSGEDGQGSGQGSGLGLSITKALCQRNGLNVGVSDGKLLSGACFWVEFPISMDSASDE
jgi:two-component system OmpR family sensor kinase/two-component system sensor histidine kinase QseC